MNICLRTGTGLTMILLVLLAIPALPAQERQVHEMGEPTEYEQLMLELVNRARANPKQAAKEAGIKLNADLPGGTISNKAKPPLAFHKDAQEAAENHSQWMLKTNTFSHTGKNGSSEQDRLKAAGYPFGAYWSIGENIGWGGTTAEVDMADNVRQRFTSLLKSPRHRTNIFKPIFRDVGMGIVQGNYTAQGETFNAVMVTQNFAVSSASASPYITGVVFQDRDDDKFYDPGEGLGGITVQAEGGQWTTTTTATGGYALPYDGSKGKLTVTFSGGPLSEPVKKTAKTTGENVKLDLIRQPD